MDFGSQTQGTGGFQKTKLSTFYWPNLVIWENDTTRFIQERRFNVPLVVKKGGFMRFKHFVLVAFLFLGLPALSEDTQSQKSKLVQGASYFVNADKLNLRSSPFRIDNIVGALVTNDQVKIVDLHPSGETRFVEIQVVSGKTGMGKNFFVAYEFLSIEKARPVVSTANSKYFVIQNIASERLRVYERCTATPDCPHRLVMQTEIVVGRDDDDDYKYRYLTWVGRYKIVNWTKFYEDKAGHYPSWYDPNYPRLPKPGADMDAWFSSRVMPNREGSARGAFGWYTALVAPNANEQWLHGTYGWGSDGDEFIRATRNFWVNLFADPRSSGCTRVENRGIAYLQYLLPVGTEVIRVYAREALRDVNLTRYQNQKQTLPWDFILTTESVRKSGAPSDKNSVLARGLDPQYFIETGTYDVVQYPYPIAFKTKASDSERRRGKSGNTYGIKDHKFVGALLVDEGRLVDYQHPQDPKIMRGGFPGEMPEYLKATGSYTLWTKRR